ncbi:hypothetical protein EWE75_23660 [Sphingomonas populi]|uniref:Uncharacterized protein n=1 Tax=Sphingomonas populi TaxID=2484750 RepID=A0A4Q6XHL3_9SPHN|nr:hypothetical protein [Sphingomonas populi]RZF59093.1 hypothetical protein EWE75_23660 [Sphingomonas populi]
MTRNNALVFATILAIGVVTMLFRGEAAAGEGLGRKTEPLGYWFIVVAASVGVVAMLVAAWLL